MSYQPSATSRQPLLTTGPVRQGKQREHDKGQSGGHAQGNGKDCHGVELASSQKRVNWNQKDGREPWPEERSNRSDQHGFHRPVLRQPSPGDSEQKNYG